MRNLIVLLLLSFVAGSCKIVKSLRELSRERPQVYSYSYQGKTIKYIPMHHLGKKEFYDNLKNTVSEYKQQGYVVYYELVTTSFAADSLVKDTIRRKARKLKGFSGTYKENAEGTALEKYVQQPSYADLGTDNKDVRADVNYLELINEWERQNGVIVLDSLDFNTPFDKKFNKGLAYSKGEYNSVFIGYRNQRLLNLIRKAPETKILVLYGAGHRKDFGRRIRSRNTTDVF